MADPIPSPTPFASVTSLAVLRRVFVDAPLKLVAYFGEVAQLFFAAILALRRGLNLADFSRQAIILGVQSIPIAILTVGFSGAVLALYTTQSLTAYGAGNLVGGIVALSILRETGPLITGVALIARGASAITAEIGTMKVTEQVDALRAMAISPVEYLVTPRLLACIVMVPVVTLFANAAGILGGLLVSVQQGQSRDQFLESVRTLVDPNGHDITEGLVKALVFGILIALVSCREGLKTDGGAAGVGKATIRSVVIALLLLFAADFLLTFATRDAGAI